MVIMPKKLTLRALGIVDCQHPLRVTNYDRSQEHCPFCGATRTPHGFTGGSIDYWIEPLFVASAKEAARKMDELEKIQ